MELLFVFRLGGIMRIIIKLMGVKFDIKMIVVYFKSFLLDKILIEL